MPLDGAGSLGRHPGPGQEARRQSPYCPLLRRFSSLHPHPLAEPALKFQAWNRNSLS
ncbi:hypothetical protein ThesuDRAFT_02122 [Thermaerobacter subterraneus DSM 13965]|uniref:Uncharacterized protein n=1 Tax=Thermaerobacter subterraneus DSM 13965 TaxID=867903 RepID=K6Q0G2_9FIRM|nr:hypothetical protein ThesuDRAFT_02122 [Thermaerobacter subterraneus DSM 13965]